MSLFNYRFFKFQLISNSTLFFFVSFLFIPPIQASQPTMPKAPYVLSQTVREWLEGDQAIMFLDVRGPKEYKAGHIRDAFNIEYNKVEKHTRKIPKDKTVVVYCTYSAWRAPYAANALADLGYTNVYVLEGGISAWNAGGQVIYASNVDQKAMIAPYSKNEKIILNHPAPMIHNSMVQLTLEELKNYDGKDGRPAYVAVDGVIYDLTQSRLWRGGEHDPSHGEAYAGRDLTEVLKKAPHGLDHLQRFPVAGYLKTE